MTPSGNDSTRWTSTDPVLIVGAGPTGLALALWLARLGVPLRLIDQSPEPGTTTRAVVVHARTLESYRQVGLAAAMVEGGRQVAGFNLWTQGVRVMRLPFGRIGEGLSPFPFVLDFPQDLHERLLLDRLAALGVRVERQTELLRFDQERDGVRASLSRPDGSVESCRAACIAGCDGAHSTVRKQLEIGFPGGTYQGLFYVADVDAGGPPINDDIHVDLDAGDFLGVFPDKPQGQVRLIGTVKPRPGQAPEQIAFEDVRGRAIEHMRLTITAVNWFSTYQNHHRVAERFRQGSAFLLGDAAHIHSPVGGQGMNTGIGDAVNLAWKLAAVLKQGAPRTLLDTYEHERRAFARRLVATTDRAFLLVTKPDGFAQFVRIRVAPRILPWLFRLSRVRRAAFRAVSQIAIQYRDSPLSAGAAGDVRGGDRLPWIQIQPGEDNFSPLEALKWQAHVYGKAHPGLAEACAELQLPLHVFPWRGPMRQAGLRRGALYLIRPDGYIGLADPAADARRLRRYLLDCGIAAG